MTTTFIHGNCLEELKKLDDEIVDCCITSPPYYALRDYGEADQIGLEDTYQEYIENLVNVFEEVKRVLKADGTLWLNLGDSYFNYRPGKGMASGKNDISKHLMDFPQELGRRGLKQKGLKNKDIMGIPFRVAFALQDQGWYLRQDIIWHKTGMPESVKDRCTKAHEYIFLLAKNEKYYFDQDAIKEDSINSEKKVQVLRVDKEELTTMYQVGV